MSFLSDLFHGNFNNLGNDLNPSNIFNDAGADAGKVLSNPLGDLAIAAGIALPFLAPEIGGFLGAGALGADAAIDPAAAAAGAGLNLGAADAALPAAATLDAGTIPASISDEFVTAFPGSAAGAVDPASLGAADLTTIGPGATSAPLNISSAVASTPGAATDTGILSSIANTLAPVSNALKTVAPIAGLGGLGLNLYEGYQTNQANKQLAATEAKNAQTAANISAADQAAAVPLLTSGQTLTQYLSTGTLPPDFEAQVKQQIDAAKASIIQGYGARGQSTNPQQNSALAQDLANVDLQAQSLRANLESTLNTAGTQMIQTANQLLSSGLSATQLSAELPIQVSQLNTQLNAAMSQSISNFSAALNGSVPNKNAITLQLPQNVINSSGTLNA